MSLKSGGLVAKLLFISSLVLLFVWVIPTMVNHYQNIKSYESKKSTLTELYSKHNITDKVKKFTIEDFKKHTESIFSDVTIEAQGEREYKVTIQVDKDKTENLNDFIESISLYYLVEVKDSELKFQDKEQLLEVKFTLVEL